MTSKDGYAKMIDDHENRIKRLEELLKSNDQPNPAGSLVSHGPKTLPDHIIRLRSSGFFSVPRTAAETHSELSGTYSCEPDRVFMALSRLAKRRELRKATKTIDGKRHLAYVA